MFKKKEKKKEKTEMKKKSIHQGECKAKDSGYTEAKSKRMYRHMQVSKSQTPLD